MNENDYKLMVQAALQHLQSSLGMIERARLNSFLVGNPINFRRDFFKKIITEGRTKILLEEGSTEVTRCVDEAIENIFLNVKSITVIDGIKQIKKIACDVESALKRKIVPQKKTTTNEGIVAGEIRKKNTISISITSEESGYDDWVYEHNGNDPVKCKVTRSTKNKGMELMIPGSFKNGTYFIKSKSNRVIRLYVEKTMKLKEIISNNHEHWDHFSISRGKSNNGRISFNTLREKYKEHGKKSTYYIYWKNKRFVIPIIKMLDIIDGLKSDTANYSISKSEKLTFAGRVIKDIIVESMEESIE
ncbi:MAG: hypothetical protein ACTSRU_11595 [Candidatus Hodarchaeales archaeon]